MRPGDEDATDGALRRSPLLHPACENGNVRDYHPRLGQQAELERELGPAGDRRRERAPLELLRDDHRDEGRLAARQGPEVVDHGVDAAPLRLDDLEVAAEIGELAEARTDPEVGVAAGHVDRAEAVAGDLVRVPERLAERRVRGLDVEDDLVRRRRGSGDRRDAGAQPPTDLAVVAVDEEEEADKGRDGDGHHPCPRQELRLDDEQRDEPRGHGADAVDRDPPLPSRLLPAAPVAHHPRLREREGREDADDVQVDQRDDVRVEDPDQERREAREHDDPVRVDEPVAEVHELARKEAVLREHGGEPREALVGRVRGEDQDREGQRLHGVVEERGRRRRGEGRTRDLRDERDRLARPRVHVDGEVRDAEEERDRDHPERAKRPGGVPALRRLEGADAVRDRLDAGEGDRSRGEGADEDEDAHGARPGRDRMRDGGLRARARDALVDPHRDHDVHDRDERVRGEGEGDPRLADAAQVHEGEEDDGGERERDLVRREAGDDRGEGEYPGCDGDGDGEDVVDEEGGRADEARQRAEVLLGDDVGAAARLIGLDGLAVGQDDDSEQDTDRDRDREDEVRGRDGGRDEDDEPGLRRIRDRGERIGGEDRESELLREERLVHLAGRPGAADEDALHGVEALRPLGRDRHLGVTLATPGAAPLQS